MARWFSSDPTLTEISEKDFYARKEIVEILHHHKEIVDVPGTVVKSFGINVGIPQHKFEDIADEILLALDRRQS